jgi:outer membrane receptor protein involved in Fe transport
VVNAAKGRTATNAVWLQDIWTVLSDLKASLGLRYEDWRAYGGSNFSASPALNVNQPRISASTLSPKASLAWQISDVWRGNGLLGRCFPHADRDRALSGGHDRYRADGAQSQSQAGTREFL